MTNFTEHLVSFKHLEEQYFEQLRDQEDEESRRLLEQQERLAYLEEANLKNDKAGMKKLPGMWPIYIVVALSVASVCSFLYSSFVVIPRYSRPSSTIPKWIPEVRVSESRISAATTSRLWDTSTGARRDGRWVATEANFGPSRVRHISSAADWDKLLSNNPDVFVHFNAAWSVWCQRLHPVWEAFSKEAERSLGDEEYEVGLVVAQVDCVALKHLCTSLKVTAYPTLRWYRSGKDDQDYTFDRTVESLLSFSKRKMDNYDYRTDTKPASGQLQLLHENDATSSREDEDDEG